MGCKLTVKVIHPESIVKKIKETMSPTLKKKRKISESTSIVTPNNYNKEVFDSDSDSYKTIYIDSP